MVVLLFFPTLVLEELYISFHLVANEKAQMWVDDPTWN